MPWEVLGAPAAAVNWWDGRRRRGRRVDDVLAPSFTTHLRLLRAAHLALIERPEKVVPEISDFLNRRARW